MREHRMHGARHRHRGWGPPFPPPGGPPWGGPWGGRKGRGGRRGNVRAAILALLAERPMHGYEMMQEIETRTGGVWRPSPGSVYPNLQLLEDEGLISSAQSEGRKRFALTEAGQAEAEKAREAAPWNEFGEEEMAAAKDFRDAGFGIMGALRQVAFAGTDEQRDQALAVLNETRRKLYAILAEGEGK